VQLDAFWAETLAVGTLVTVATLSVVLNVRDVRRARTPTE
jgi:hypothetical protein